MDFVQFAAKRRRRGGGAAPDYALLVEAAVAGTPALVFDPMDAATLWQTDDTSTPWATNGDPVGRITSKWGSAPVVLTQATGISRPPVTDGLLSPSNADGANDGLNGLVDAATLQAVSKSFFCFKYRNTVSGAGQSIIGLSHTTTNAAMATIAAGNANQVSIQLRRLTGDLINTFVSGAILLPYTEYVITFEVDYAGTGSVTLRINGDDITSGGFPGTLANAVGVTSNVVNRRVALLQTLALVGTSNGRVGRILVAGKGMTTQERADIEAWVGQSEVMAQSAGDYGWPIARGARTWFNGEVAIRDGNNVLFTVAEDSLTPRLMSWDLTTKFSNTEYVMSNVLGSDDHNEGGVLKTSAGTYLYGCCGHKVADYYMARGAIGQVPSGMSEVNLDATLLDDGYSYVNLYQLGSTIYAFGRQDGNHWKYTSSVDDGATWTAYQTWLSSSAGRAYPQFCQDGARLYFISCTDTPDSNTKSSIFAGYFEGGLSYKLDGTLVVPNPADPTDFTLIWHGVTENEGSWTWDIKYIGGVLYMGFSTIADADPTTHRYRLATYSGGTLTVEMVVSDAGSYLYVDQPSYSGGFCIDPLDPTIIYACIDPGDDLHQLNRMDRVSEGVWTPTPLTSAPLRCFRPHMVGNVLTYCKGTYVSFTNFDDCVIMGVLT